MTSIRHLPLLLILTCIYISSCDKNSNKLKDFRDKYIGKYQVTETIKCYGACGTCFSIKDTLIIVNYGITDSTLNVLGREVFLDSAGNYHDYHYGLRLWNDSIYSYYMNGLLGCGQNEIYEGIRVSIDP